MPCRTWLTMAARSIMMQRYGADERYSRDAELDPRHRVARQRAPGADGAGRRPGRGVHLRAASRRDRTQGRRLGGLGVGSGDVVAVVAKNSADFLLHAYALMRAGATPAFVNWRLFGRELAEVLALVEPKAIAADGEFAGLVSAAW